MGLREGVAGRPVEAQKGWAMKIDDRIEPLVREGLQAAVKQDDDRFDRAIKAFPDASSRHAAVELLILICQYVTFDLHGGQRPTDEQIRILAEQVAQAEAWVGLTADEVATFLRLIMGEPASEIEPHTGVVMVFVVTASLLAGKPRPEGKYWFNYLDLVEAALEASDSAPH
jgi:hypothetical protein